MSEMNLKDTGSAKWQALGKLLLLGLFLALFSTPLLAQQTGDIAGKVTNLDGSVVAGATVKATSPGLPGERNTTTSANGDYRLPLLPPGTYTLEFTTPDGVTRSRVTDVFLQQRSTVNLVIDPAEMALEEVLVVGTTPLLETSKASISDAIGNEMFDALPVGQEYRDLVKLIPGVQYTQDSVRGPSAGGNGQDNQYQFDGVDVTLPLFGVLSAEPSTHDIDQVTMVRGGATAIGFNRSGGFKINTTSKRGTNEFDGQVSYQVEDASWEADRKGQTLDYDQTKEWWLANVSGPLVKDQLYFYASYYNPNTDRANRANAYGEVPDYSYTRDEYFGKLTWAPTDSLLLDASYRSSDAEGKGESIGSFESPEGSQGSEATLDIVILEGSWIVNDRSSVYFKYSDFENKTKGRPDFLLSVQPSLGGSLDISNLDQMGHFNIPTLRAGNDAFNAWAQPLIARYGYPGNVNGGGYVGPATQINVQDFFRESFEIGYDITLDLGPTTHDLHFGYHQEEVKEHLVRYTNGWGLIESIGGLDSLNGVPIYYRANVDQQSLADYGVPPIDSYSETVDFEINDSISWGDWTFNVGVLFSQDKLFGQGLKPSSSTTSGYEVAIGNKYLMKQIDFDEMIQPRLGVNWDFNDQMSFFANYARYYPVASSLARAASWDRNLRATRYVYFDENGDFIGSQTEASSTGKLFQEGIDPRHIDEFLVGMNWQPTDNLTTRMHYRVREARDFWEDTPNNSRIVTYNNPPYLGRGNMPEGWAPVELYMPTNNLVGTSSYVIAQLDKSTTSYHEVSFEAQWDLDRLHLQGSYTWSEYVGNFDQDNTTTGNDAAIFIGSSNIADGVGRQVWDLKNGTLRGDRPHLLKLYGFYEFNWNAVLGAYFVYQSGQPWETWDGSYYRPGFSSTIRYAEPAGSHRSASHHQLDLNYTQNFFLGTDNRYAVQLRADVYNVFDKQTGYNIQPVLSAAGYGQPRSYYQPRRLQLTAKFLF